MRYGFDLFDRARSTNKTLQVVEGATHYGLYDQPGCQGSGAVGTVFQRASLKSLRLNRHAPCGSCHAEHLPLASAQRVGETLLGARGNGQDWVQLREHRHNDKQSTADLKSTVLTLIITNPIKAKYEVL